MTTLKTVAPFFKDYSETAMQRKHCRAAAANKQCNEKTAALQANKQCHEKTAAQRRPQSMTRLPHSGGNTMQMQRDGRRRKLLSKIKAVWHRTTLADRRRQSQEESRIN